MTDRSATPATFVLERSFDASPARLFKALTVAEQKSAWFGDPTATAAAHAIDFRVGGEETASGGSDEGPKHYYRAVFQDIVTDERIVTTYTMRYGDELMSVSVATYEIQPEGTGSRLVLTEQGVFLDGLDQVGAREHGTGELLEALATYLDKQAAEG